MFPYWIIYVLFALGSLGPGEGSAHASRSRPLVILALVFVTLMIGLRFEVGTDWGAYLRMFGMTQYLDFSELFSLSGSEPTYAIISWIAVKFGFGIWLVNLICAAILGIGLFAFSRTLKRPMLSLLIATPFIILIVGMGYTRQSAALGLVLLSIVAVQREKTVAGIVLVLVAATFHRSALIVLPIVGIAYSRNRLLTIPLVLSAAILGYFTLLSSEWDRLNEVYIQQQYQAAGASFRLGMNMLPALLFLIMRKRLELPKVQLRLWTTVSLIAVATFAMLYFTSATVALDRLSIYLTPLQMFVLSQVPDWFGQQRKGQLAIVALLFFYIGLIEAVWLNYGDNARFWVPYQTVFSANRYDL